MDEMICNSFLFFDRIVEMMIIGWAIFPDMNPADVLHYMEKFEPSIISSHLLLTNLKICRKNRAVQDIVMKWHKIPTPSDERKMSAAVCVLIWTHNRLQGKNHFK